MNVQDIDEARDTLPSFDGYVLKSSDIVNEFGEKDLFREQDAQDRMQKRQTTDRVMVIGTNRFRIVAYTDAAFAVNELKQSISGWIIYLNGTPILFGSSKQTVVVDSSCSDAEYVAASICVKKIMELENMLDFLEVNCTKPYRMYTDSMACKHIACNHSRLGKVRHLAIRTHLIRCHISLGDIELVWCTPESMVADLMTKVVSGAQDKRLTIRFYNDVGEPLTLSDPTSLSVAKPTRTKKRPKRRFEIDTENSTISSGKTFYLMKMKKISEGFFFFDRLVPILFLWFLFWVIMFL
jgi:hypothetical protein